MTARSRGEEHRADIPRLSDERTATPAGSPIRRAGGGAAAWRGAAASPPRFYSEIGRNVFGLWGCRFERERERGFAGRPRRHRAPLGPFRCSFGVCFVAETAWSGVVRRTRPHSHTHTLTLTHTLTHTLTLTHTHTLTPTPPSKSCPPSRNVRVARRGKEPLAPRGWHGAAPSRGWRAASFSPKGAALPSGARLSPSGPQRVAASVRDCVAIRAILKILLICVQSTPNPISPEISAWIRQD